MNITRIIGAIGCALGLAGPQGAWADAPVMAERTMVSVDPQAHYRAVYDSHSAETAAGVSKGLYYARGLKAASQAAEPERNVLVAHACSAVVFSDLAQGLPVGHET